MDSWIDFCQTIAILVICVWIYYHGKVHRYERLIRQENLRVRPRP